VDSEFYLIDQRPSPWVEMKRFELGAPLQKPEDELLPLLLAHPEYRDGYKYHWDDEPIHGPYRQDAVTAESFELVSPSEARAILTTWLDYLGPLDELASARELADVFRMIERSALIFHLPALGKDAEFELNLLDEFLEFVVMGPEGQVVVLVVAED